jgi:hypothetical protein
LAITIQPYRQEHEAAVGEFNARLTESQSNPHLIFSESAIPRWLPPTNDSPVWNEYYLALESGSVRGAYGLKQEMIFVRGKGLQRVACYHHPLSEGIINRSYASVGVLLTRDALARQPFLYALGMGGVDRPIAQMLKALGFSLTTIPFFFRVLNPSKFLREMKAFRQEAWRASLMSLAAATGTGWLVIKSAQKFKSLSSRPGPFVVQEIGEFSGWAEDLWNECKEGVSMATVRDANTLQRLYPASLNSVKRLRVGRNGIPIGWAIVGLRRKDAKFGEMRVGSIVDCWASPENAPAVVRAATESLKKDGFDLIVSNQSHRVWRHAFETGGFLKGPSNFVFAASKKLTGLLQPLEENRPSFHITRADGDGLPANF